MAKSQNFSYTFNNYTELDVVTLQALEAKYHVFGYEEGKEGTPHLQGTICFASNMRLSGAIKKLKGAHVEITRNKEASIQYSKKEGNFWESGPAPFKVGQKTSDAITYDDVIACRDMEEVLRLPGISSKMTWASRVWRLKPRPLEDLPDELRPWQKDEISNLLLQDNRKIRFIVDYKGGIGKTVLAKTLVQDHGAYYTRGGKHADIAYAYEFQPIVVFDLSRSNEEAHWPYPIMECFKDGMLFSGKYESETKTFPACKVIVMCNQMPDTSKLSADRFDIFENCPPAYLEEQMK